MKVRLFLQDTVEDFADKHSTGKKLFVGWINAIKGADWNEPLDITRTVKGNLIGNGSDRVVFDIGGNSSNSFRIICSYQFGFYYKKSKEYKIHLFVNWIGTHEEYNRLTEERKLTISDY
jgi:mRNA interferase HigB